MIVCLVLLAVILSNSVALMMETFSCEILGVILSDTVGLIMAMFGKELLGVLLGFLNFVADGMIYLNGSKGSLYG